MNRLFHQRIASLPHLARGPSRWLVPSNKVSPVGFSLIEVLIVVAILGVLAGIAIPVYSYYVEKARITEAIAEIRILEKEIVAYQEKNETVPDTLADIERGNLQDPWENPYQYLNLETASGKGKIRKYKSKQLNSEFDLYSMGKDGKSASPLTAKPSKDDIVRADNGKYVGLASEY